MHKNSQPITSTSQTDKPPTHTFQTRLRLDPQAEQILFAYAIHMSHVEHTLFAKYCSGAKLNDLKSSYLKSHKKLNEEFCKRLD